MPAPHRIDAVRNALGTKLRRVEPGGGSYAGERQQWDSGNNVVAIEPAVVFAYRNTYTNELLRNQGALRPACGGEHEALHGYHSELAVRLLPRVRRWGRRFIAFLQLMISLTDAVCGEMATGRPPAVG